MDDPLACAHVLVPTQRAGPVADQADLAEGEGDEHADHVELDQRGDGGVEDEHEDDGGHGERDDAVGEGKAVAAGVQLPR